MLGTVAIITRSLMASWYSYCEYYGGIYTYPHRNCNSCSFIKSN